MQKPVDFIEVEAIATELNALRVLIGCVAAEAELNGTKSDHYTPALYYVSAALFKCYKRLWKYIEEEPTP